MAKILPQDLKAKISEKIKKAEKDISSLKEKIKAWQNEIKSIEAEENKNYADRFLNIIFENGLTSEKERNEILAEISKFVKTAATVKNENASASVKNEKEENLNSDKNEK